MDYNRNVIITGIISIFDRCNDTCDYERLFNCLTGFKAVKSVNNVFGCVVIGNCRKFLFRKFGFNSACTIELSNIGCSTCDVRNSGKRNGLISTGRTDIELLTCYRCVDESVVSCVECIVFFGTNCVELKSTLCCIAITRECNDVSLNVANHVIKSIAVFYAFNFFKVNVNCCKGILCISEIPSIVIVVVTVEVNNCAFITMKETELVCLACNGVSNITVRSSKSASNNNSSGLTLRASNCSCKSVFQCFVVIFGNNNCVSVCFFIQNKSNLVSRRSPYDCKFSNIITTFGSMVYCRGKSEVVGSC